MSKTDKSIDCPNCAESVKAEAILCRYCQSGLSSEYFSECPFCSEMVRKNVSLCRYCKTSLASHNPVAGRSANPMRTPSLLIEPFRQHSSAETERFDPRYDKDVEPFAQGKDDSSKFQANMKLIRERAKIIVEQMQSEWTKVSGVRQPAEQQMRARVREVVNSDPARLTMMEKGILLQTILDDLFGFGPLGPLFRDPTVGNICVNGTHSVYAERHGRLEKSTVTFKSAEQLRKIIDKIIEPLGCTLDKHSPMVEGRLPNGSHVTATIPPISIDGPTLTLRRFSPITLSLEQLVAQGFLSVQMAEVLKACVKGRANIIISGDSGSGKTTLLNALSAYIGSRERIITIEDAAELSLKHENWVRLETRPRTIQNDTEVTKDMLISTSLHMRPDRIILGECRGTEAFHLIQAMDTGYNGSMTTINSPTASDCLQRLEMLSIMPDGETHRAAARLLITKAVQVIVQISRLADGTRRIIEICEISDLDGDKIALSTLFHLKEEGRDPRGFFKCRHVGSALTPRFLEQIEKEGVPFKLDWLRGS